VPLFALTIDFILNSLVISYLHLPINIALLTLYFFASFIGQLAQKGIAIYLHNLDWTRPDIASKYYAGPDWKSNQIFIGTTYGCLIGFHIFFTALSNYKAQYYSGLGRRMSERSVR
jgi:hypothetical protein